jgi:fimbrial chaperone protein
MPTEFRLADASSARPIPWSPVIPRKLKSALLMVLLLISHSAIGDGLRVSPLKVEFNKDNNSALVKISNGGGKKFTVQLDAMSWTQDAAGQDQHTPTSDIVFFPRIFSIEPGDQRTVRVGYQGEPALNREKTYRLYAQELPVEEPGVIEMKFAIRMSIPIFVYPDSRNSAWDIDGVEWTDQGLSVRVENSGNTYISVGAIELSGRSATGAELFTLNEHGWYVLAGRSRNFLLPWSGELCDQLASFDLSVTWGSETRSKQHGVAATDCPASTR